MFKQGIWIVIRIACYIKCYNKHRVILTFVNDCIKCIEMIPGIILKRKVYPSYKPICTEIQEILLLSQFIGTKAIL